MPTTPNFGAPRRRSGPGRPRPSGAVRRPATEQPLPALELEIVDTPPEPTTFEALGVPAPILAALVRAGCETPFPIQAATLPSSLAGRDVLGRARTGSGKTVAFAVPMVMALAKSAKPRRPNLPRALVLVPTRELASQVAATTEPLARAMGLRVAIVHGGVSQGPQVSALRQGVDILVACPGRLEDLVQQGHCRLSAVEVCVLDEADHLADLGFLPAVKRILDQTPTGGQRLLFSATLDRAVDAVVRRYLVRPITHSVDSADATPPDLEHHTFSVTPDDKAAVVRELASGRERSLLFTRTKHAAKKLAKDLTARGIPALDLHGNLSQSQRDRNLAAFAEGTTRVLVATDIAARGIHVDDIALVVHVDPPTEHKAYLHRSGRTARAGAKGTVVTVILPDQARDVATMIRQAGIRPAAARIGPGAHQTVALTGPFAEPEFRPQATVVTPQRPGRAPTGGATRGRSGRPGQPGGAPRRSGTPAGRGRRPR
ncbi:MAG: DEAD/DEAH box helicase [Actinomycetota bacterium]|nr:DEAD/DEAH box helicase [Actinomycetota bacterium]